MHNSKLKTIQQITRSTLSLTSKANKVEPAASQQGSEMAREKPTVIIGKLVLDVRKDIQTDSQLTVDGSNLTINTYIQTLIQKKNIAYLRTYVCM